MKTRTASCCCGDLSLTVTGDPERVILCHCDYCQRRTGNVSQISCWCFGDQIQSRTGRGQMYRGPENIGIDYTFCTRCGSTVYWEFSAFRELVDVPVYGIAVGCFAEPDFPSPDLEIWASKRHPGSDKIEGIDSYDEFPPRERLMPRRPKGSDRRSDSTGV